MLNRLTKSAEVQTQVDDEYFKINMEGHQMRLKLENTLKNCQQVSGRGGGSDPCPVPLMPKVQLGFCVSADPAGAGEAADRSSGQHPEPVPPPDDQFWTDPEARENVSLAP